MFTVWSCIFFSGKVQDPCWEGYEDNFVNSLFLSRRSIIQSPDVYCVVIAAKPSDAVGEGVDGLYKMLHGTFPGKQLLSCVSHSRSSTRLFPSSAELSVA